MVEVKTISGELLGAIDGITEVGAQVGVVGLLVGAELGEDDGNTVGNTEGACVLIASESDAIPYPFSEKLVARFCGEPEAYKSRTASQKRVSPGSVASRASIAWTNTVVPTRVKRNETIFIKPPDLRYRTFACDVVVRGSPATKAQMRSAGRTVVVEIAVPPRSAPVYVTSLRLVATISTN